MNRIAKAVAAALLAIGLAVVGLPLGGGPGGATINVGSTGCCKI